MTQYLYHWGGEGEGGSIGIYINLGSEGRSDSTGSADGTAR
jgi:hypothetical protein